MICKECIHLDVCTAVHIGGEYQENAEKCKNFKNKADLVEVVRCSECRFNVANMEKDEYDTTDYSGEDIVCSYFMTDGMLPDDFCSYGKRRDE